MANARDLMLEPERFLLHLRQMMQLHGLTQRELADAGCLSRFHVNRVLRGRVPHPELRTLMRMSAALDLLLYGERI